MQEKLFPPLSVKKLKKKAGKPHHWSSKHSNGFHMNDSVEASCMEVTFYFLQLCSVGVPASPNISHATMDMTNEHEPSHKPCITLMDISSS